MKDTIICGDVRYELPGIPSESCDCCVTSPPYWRIRDYGDPRQLGMENTPAEYVANIVATGAEIWRILKPGGTFWLNLGDTYIKANGSCHNPGGGIDSLGKRAKLHKAHPVLRLNISDVKRFGLKRKDLVMIPARVALALQEWGWYVRSDIIWHKPNTMPESTKDRPTTVHEHLFLLTKQDRYYYDYEAIKEPCTGNAQSRGTGVNPKARKVPGNWETGPGRHDRVTRDGPRPRQNPSFSGAVQGLVKKRNKRSVWTIPTQPFKGAHFSVFPEKLAEPCILAGCPKGGTVLDPFAGAFTVPLVAKRLGRGYVAIELVRASVRLGKRRLLEKGLLD